ncbi:MAG: hypothetical protein KJ821_07975 [Actinobacteria bacterium]|nr:hypothetical protein [Actinomycetota bacterium]
MNKSLLRGLILAISIALVIVFSSGGCRGSVPPVEEPVVEELVVEEVTDEPEEEDLDESEEEEIVEETTTKGKIAFYSNRDGNYEIYIMNIDGSEQTRLTNNPGDDIFPSFSPDGSKIAFDYDYDGACEIYIMNVVDRSR